MYESYVFGNRFVHGVAKRNDAFIGWGRYRSLRVLDFNRFAVRRSACVGGSEGDHGMDGDKEDESHIDTESGYSDDDDGDGGGEDIGQGKKLVHRAICRTITTTSVIPRGSPFLLGVHSSLPYREITKRVSHPPFSSVTIDDERIICYASDMHTWVHTM